MTTLGNMNDEFNCLALSPESVKNEVVPRQATEGLLHIQRGYNWYVFAIDVNADEHIDLYHDLLTNMAKEACQSTIVRSDVGATYQLIHFDDPSVPVAHLTVNTKPDANLNRFYDSVGRFDFNILSLIHI